MKYHINEGDNPIIHLKEKRKEVFIYFYYVCQPIFIETSVTFHGAFFKQHLEFDILFCETSNTTKGIFLTKVGTLKLE